MALKLHLDSLDDLDENLHDFYVEDENGGFKLDLDGQPPGGGGGDNEKLDGFKKALDASRKAEREATKLLDKYQKSGMSPEEIREAKDKLETAKRKKLADEGEFEKLLQQHEQKWDDERKSLTNERDSAQNALKSYVGENAFVSELVKSNATEEGVELLPLRFRNRITVEIVDGKPSVEIMQADGETPMAGSGPGGRATMADLVEEARGKFGSLFKAPGKGGSGKQPHSGSGKPSKKFDEMTGDELSKLRREDPKEYERLKAERDNKG